MLTDYRVALAIQAWRRRRAEKRAEATINPPTKGKVHWIRRWE